MYKLFNKLRIPALFISIFILTYCSSYSYIPTSADITKARMEWPNIDSSTMFLAYNTYKDNCGNCHFLYRPEKYNKNEWDHILQEMKTEAKLTDDNVVLIKKYLYTHTGNK
jgi:hypothetical protein